MKKSELVQMVPTVDITKHLWSYHFVNFNCTFKYNVITEMMSFFVNGKRISHFLVVNNFTPNHFKRFCRKEFVKFMDIGMKIN